MTERTPYLSVVATSRNDDHGGSLLRRMQVFVRGFIEQCERHGLEAELILVEWNPPFLRPGLVDVLRWPNTFGPCEVRIVEVPPGRHRRLRHAEVLPLFQMIAKNVGIRRARGEFVLATNIDIVFSDELMGFLAARRLETGRMYRIDRHDVMTDVPLEATIEEQLAYCQTHLIRVNAREGSFRLEPDGRRALEPDDIVPADSGIRLGAGFHPVWRRSLGGPVVPVRPCGPRGEIVVTAGDTAPVPLVLDVQPVGPGESLEMALLDETGAVIRTWRLSERALLRADLAMGPRETRRFVLQAGASTAGDPPSVAFEAHEVRWVVPADEERPFLPARAPGEVGGPAPARPEASPPRLHTNGCGDFTLLSREKWLDLRGYPEFEMFSFHIDSMFCYSAHHGGARETVLPDPMRIYHIEHGVGSGWTPEGQQRLFDRLDTRHLPYLTNDVVMDCATLMRRLEAPMIFNGADWGMGGEELPERFVVPPRAMTA